MLHKPYGHYTGIHMTGKIFISYARNDVNFAQKLNTNLERKGILTWIDQLGIRSGEDWPERIAIAIEECHAMLVVLSPDSVASKWVQRELAYADQHGKRVLPLLYKPCKLPRAFQLRFSNVQRADFTSGGYDTNLTALLGSLQDVLGVAMHPSLTITTPLAMELIRIPAGEFLMGSDKKKDNNAIDHELPQHKLYLPEYFIAKTPVTNAQYAVFVKAAGQRAPSHWTNGNIPSGKETHPVVNVSWHDAIAFCRWLSEQTGRDFTLPSEAEWEKAARAPPPPVPPENGGDGRRPGGVMIGEGIYPWGDEWDKAKCNTSESGIKTTTPVGKYSPAGDSPYGCADMAGNVWEWMRSLWGTELGEPDFKYPYDPADGRENLDAPDSDLRVLRGGSWCNDHRLARCAYRFRDFPFLDWGNLGFRVVAGSLSP